VAYSIVDKSGDRVYVRPFDGTSGPFLVDANAQDPKWSANGRELFYTSSVFSVLFQLKIATTPAAPLPASTAVELKRLPSDTFALNYDVLRDGRVLRHALASRDSHLNDNAIARKQICAMSRTAQSSQGIDDKLAEWLASSRELASDDQDPAATIITRS